MQVYPVVLALPNVAKFFPVPVEFAEDEGADEHVHDGDDDDAFFQVLAFQPLQHVVLRP